MDGFRVMHYRLFFISFPVSLFSAEACNKIFLGSPPASLAQLPSRQYHYGAQRFQSRSRAFIYADIFISASRARLTSRADGFILLACLIKMLAQFSIPLERSILALPATFLIFDGYTAFRAIPAPRAMPGDSGARFTILRHDIILMAA